MTTALLSVSDKTGIVEFAQALNAQGVRLMNVDDGERVVAIEAFADTDPEGGNSTPPEEGESGANSVNGAAVNGALEAAPEGDAPPGGDPGAAN